MAQGRWGPRELLAAGGGWLAGLALLHRCERLPTPAELAGLAAWVVVLCLWRHRHWLLVGALAAGVAFTQAAWRADQRLSNTLHPAWEGRDLVLSGQIDSLPVAVTGQGGVPGWRFEFAVEAVGPTGTALPPEVPPRLMLLAYDAPPITAGERWRFTARLKRAHGLANRGASTPSSGCSSRACAPRASCGPASGSRPRRGGRWTRRARHFARPSATMWPTRPWPGCWQH